MLSHRALTDEHTDQDSPQAQLERQTIARFIDGLDSDTLSQPASVGGILLLQAAYLRYWSEHFAQGTVGGMSMTQAVAAQFADVLETCGRFDWSSMMRNREAHAERHLPFTPSLDDSAMAAIVLERPLFWLLEQNPGIAVPYLCTLPMAPQPSVIVALTLPEDLQTASAVDTPALAS